MPEKYESLMFWGLFFTASLLLAVLKLAGFEEISWLIVALPILTPFAILLLALFFVVVIFGTFTRRRR